MGSRREFYLAPRNSMAEFVEYSMEEIRHEELQKLDKNITTYAIFSWKGEEDKRDRFPDLFRKEETA